jgi:hypothetical protein
MIEVEHGIVLRDNQDPPKEAGKAVRELKLIAMVCNICDKHYGRFNRLYLEVAQMLHKLTKKSKDDDTESNSSILSSPDACVAIEADGSSTANKRKRPPYEEGKEDD